MFIKIIIIGLLMVFGLSGCTHKEVSVKNDNALTYVPMKIDEEDKNSEKKENDTPEALNSDTPKEELSDFQKHMLYRDYKVVK